MLRIRDYPSVRAYCPDFLRRSSFWGQSRLPAERNRTLFEDAEFKSLWRRIDARAIFERLEEARAAITR